MRQSIYLFPNSTFDDFLQDKLLKTAPHSPLRGTCETPKPCVGIGRDRKDFRLSDRLKRLEL
jgi:hypothetical protein